MVEKKKNKPHFWKCPDCKRRTKASFEYHESPDEIRPDRSFWEWLRSPFKRVDFLTGRKEIRWRTGTCKRCKRNFDQFKRGKTWITERWPG